MTRCGRPRRTARTPRPCSAGWPVRPRRFASARGSSRCPARSAAMTAMTAATIDQLSGRAHDPRDRLLRAAGRRGLARAALRQAAAAHARVRRRRAHGARARTRGVPRRDARAAAPRRSRQGAEADDLPRAGADPDLPRRDRAEEHRARRRDRRRLDPDAVLARARLGAAPAAAGGRRALGAIARRVRHRADRERVHHRRPATARAMRCGRSSPSTSAAWARASRTSTTSSSSATASRREAATDPGSLPRRQARGGDGRDSRRADRHASRCAAPPTSCASAWPSTATPVSARSASPRSRSPRGAPRAAATRRRARQPDSPSGRRRGLWRSERESCGSHIAGRAVTRSCWARSATRVTRSR